MHIQPKPTAYQIIRQKIVTMDYLPGITLDEKTLCEQIGYSRTPIREAFIKLSGEGLIDITKNRSARVTELDLRTLQAVWEASELIERACLTLACLRRTKADLASVEACMKSFEQRQSDGDVQGMVLSNIDFHMSIANSAKNKYFSNAYQQILADQERIAQYWYSTNVADNNSANQLAIAQHQKIYCAIEQRNTDSAISLMTMHSSLCKESITDMLSTGVDALKELEVNT